jgi:hypothetical protein
MVRADLLDQIDITLRQTRKKWQFPFGGVQVLLIGDMHQLPPVVQPEEWSLLSAHYPGVYFFESRVIKNNPPVFIELEKIYRQNEQEFIDLLNKVRNNALDEKALARLNACYRAGLTQKDYENNITLTTHNRKADEINQRSLSALPGKAYTFKCKTDGLFSDKNYPAEEELILKVGARVMFLKNNTEKNYYNGKIGVVSNMDGDKIKVKCEEDKNEIEVVRETWTNVSYKVNRTTHHVEEEILGTFGQFPLRLAWAITIHKSQGLTFDQLIIDAAESFSSGQVYVALSRCRSLKGLILSSAITPRSLLSDQNVIRFNASRQSNDQLSVIYEYSRNQYIKGALFSLFDFSEQLAMRQDLGGSLVLHKTRINAEGHAWAATLFSGIEALSEVGAKFKNQLTGLLEVAHDVETNETVQQRVAKAATYFEAEIKKVLDLLQNCSLVTESKETAEDLAPKLQRLFETLFEKRAFMKASHNGFQFADFVKQKLQLTYPQFRVEIYASAKNTRTSANVKHPPLFRQLLLLRDEICNDEQVPVYLVATNKTLTEMADFLPDTEDALMQIAGFGEARVDAYGTQFLRIIRQFMEANELQTLMHLKAPKKTKKKKEAKSVTDEDVVPKTGTKEQTLALFKQGLSLPEIARQRGYTVGTIEQHLVPFVASGEIALDLLVSAEKQERINKALVDFDQKTGLNPIKSKLPADVSFSEIRYVLAARLHNS